MDWILTLVASDNSLPVTGHHIQEVEQSLAMEICCTSWLSPDKAVDLYLPVRLNEFARKRLEALLAPDRIDFFFMPDDGNRRKKLLIADMDSTIVIGETLDDLAARCGLKERVAVITKQAMAGRLDFKEALTQRVAMLEGLPELALQETLEEVQPMAGAELLVKTMRDHGAVCILASGGFSCFTEPVAEQLGFHFNHGNRLSLAEGKLTGKVVGPVVDHLAKLALLQHYQQHYQIDTASCLAVGDGANDLSMIRAAGLGIGYHPKAYLKKRIENSVLFGDLTALLYAQGYQNF